MESELKPCPFCGGENINIGSYEANKYRNDFGDMVHYRVYSARCNRCHARGKTVGGMCSEAEKTVKVDGRETKVKSYKQMRSEAAKEWNRRTDNG